jgi:hypothetical protein
VERTLSLRCGKLLKRGRLDDDCWKQFISALSRSSSDRLWWHFWSLWWTWGYILDVSSAKAPTACNCALKLRQHFVWLSVRVLATNWSRMGQALNYVLRRNSVFDENTYKLSLDRFLENLIHFISIQSRRLITPISYWWVPACFRQNRISSTHFLFIWFESNFPFHCFMCIVCGYLMKDEMFFVYLLSFIFIISFR